MSTTGAKSNADSIVDTMGVSLIPPEVDGRADWTWLKINIPTIKVTAAVTIWLKLAI
jgi:hypothetical protein